MRSRSWIAASLLAASLHINPMGGIALAADGDVMATPHTERQAGYPQTVSPLARESYGEHYSGGYVGGGTLFRGHGRCAQEGTWGWDYTPFRPISPRIFLGRSHGSRYQGGTGSYRTDGPRPMEHIKEAVHGHFGGDE